MQEIPCHALIKKVKYKWWMVRSLWTREKCYPTRFKWHRQRKPGSSLQSFALKLRSCFCKCCFSSPTSYRVYAVANSSDFTVTTPVHFLEAWFFPTLLAWPRCANAPLPNHPLPAAAFPSLCHYPWLEQHNFKMNSPDCLDCSRWAKAYLAVCSTDRKSNIGSYHNCERRSQLNSESTAGSIRKHFTITLCISSDWYHAACQSLTRFFFPLFYLHLIFGHVGKLREQERAE